MGQTHRSDVDHGPALPVCAFGLQFLVTISLPDTHVPAPHSEVAQHVGFCSFAGFTAVEMQGI